MESSIIDEMESLKARFDKFVTNNAVHLSDIITNIATYLLGNMPSSMIKCISCWRKKNDICSLHDFLILFRQLTWSEPSHFAFVESLLCSLMNNYVPQGMFFLFTMVWPKSIQLVIEFNFLALVSYSS